MKSSRLAFYVIVTPFLLVWRLLLLPLYLVHLTFWFLSGVFERIGNAAYALHQHFFWAVPPPWLADVEKLVENATQRDRDLLVAGLKRDRGVHQ